MTMMRWAAAADLHFDEQGPWRYKGILGDAAYGLEQVVDYCLAESLDMLLLLGDLMNRPTPRQLAVRQLHDQMDRCAEGQIPVSYVLGDHDGRQDWLGLHPWPMAAHERLLLLGPWIGYGLDYQPRGRLQETIARLPAKAHVLITHQKWEELISHSGQAKLAELPDSIRYVLTGDYHDALWGQFGRDQQVWSPGSTHALNVAETKPRQFLVGSGQPGQFRCEFRPLKSRRIYRLRITTAEELARLLETGITAILQACTEAELPEALRMPIVEVTYFTDLPEVHARLQTLADRCFLFLRPRDRERAQRHLMGRAQNDMDLAEAITRLAPAGTPGHDWTLRLLQAADRQTEWQALVHEFQEAENAPLSCSSDPVGGRVDVL